MRGYYVKVGSKELVYVPFNFVVIDHGSYYDVRNTGSDIRLFDRHWDNNEIYLFDRGIVRSGRVLDCFFELDVNDFSVSNHLTNCFLGRMDLADLTAISLLEEAKESVCGG